MAKRPLHLDILTENILGVQRYQYEDDAKRDTEYKHMLYVLRKAMQGELTQRQQFCMHAYYFENRTQADIAQELGLRISTVNKHLKKAKDRLYKVMQYSFQRLE